MGAGFRVGTLPPFWKGPRGVVLEDVGVVEVVVVDLGRAVCSTVTADMS